MKSFLTQAALGAAAFAFASAASAGVIDFEHVDTSGLSTGAPFVLNGDYVTQGSYFVNGQDASNSSGLVGSLMNGADPSSCLDAACPTGNPTNFYGALNDGVVHIGALDGSEIALTGFDAAFLPPFGVTLGSGVVAYLAIEGDRADHSFAVGILPLAGPIDGLTAFGSFGIGDLTYVDGTGTVAENVTDLFAYAYYCDQTSGNCSAFSSNKAQFALDNVAFSTQTAVVPEPSSWLLMSLGLGGVGAAVRRRRPA